MRVRTATGAEAVQTPGEGAKAPVEGEWRCSACGHGDNLYACAYGVISGALLPNGDVQQDWVDQTDLAEDSIECQVHPAPGGALERWLSGRWNRWQNCDWRSDDGYYYCHWGRKLYRIGNHNRGQCPSCEGTGGAWAPVQQSADSSAPRTEAEGQIDQDRSADPSPGSGR